ncbi:MAG TPA: formyltransferase family protein, partial [Myxococcota bacterium]|nr:formyltransferase family protein [Myxococcota bacterium]
MSLRIALFGQAAFGREALERLRANGHEIAGVFAPPEAGRPDALAQRAQELGLPLVRRRFYRKKTGEAIPAALAEHAALGADLNVLASVQVFLPRELCDAPKHKSLCFHPSLLPRFRGGAALQWQIILGEAETGVTIFVPDAGADTGPIVLQKGPIAIAPRETVTTLFFEKLSPLGVEALVEAVELVASGKAAPRVQDESRASAQG